MADAAVLIYHMKEDRMRRLKEVCSSMGIRAVPVDREAERAPVGLLSGMLDPVKLARSASGQRQENRGPKEIDEEMIVMAGFTEQLFNSFLDRLKEKTLRIDLKAVQTETNLYWSGEMLQAELKRERELYRNMMHMNSPARPL